MAARSAQLTAQRTTQTQYLCRSRNGTAALRASAQRNPHAATAAAPKKRDQKWKSLVCAIAARLAMQNACTRLSATLTDHRLTVSIARTAGAGEPIRRPPRAGRGVRGAAMDDEQQQQQQQRWPQFAAFNVQLAWLVRPSTIDARWSACMRSRCGADTVISRHVRAHL